MPYISSVIPACATRQVKNFSKKIEGMMKPRNHPEAIQKGFRASG
jgi:hypothetical protein